MKRKATATSTQKAKRTRRVDDIDAVQRLGVPPPPPPPVRRTPSAHKSTFSSSASEPDAYPYLASGQQAISTATSSKAATHAAAKVRRGGVKKTAGELVSMFTNLESMEPQEVYDKVVAFAKQKDQARKDHLEWSGY